MEPLVAEGVDAAEDWFESIDLGDDPFCSLHLLDAYDKKHKGWVSQPENKHHGFFFFLTR